jgi:hypothetical protein
MVCLAHFSCFSVFVKFVILLIMQIMSHANYPSCPFLTKNSLFVFAFLTVVLVYFAFVLLVKFVILAKPLPGIAGKKEWKIKTMS